MKKALILGAGMVAKPIIDYLLKTGNISIICATRTISKAQNILQNRPNTQAVPLLVDNDADLENVIKTANIIISLLPYTYHVKTAKICLKYGIPLVTTSYVSPQMKELNGEARAKNIIFLNEIGLDPGIDHMSAMRIIHDVEKRGGKITSFRSYCGGIPAPDSNNNPWEYKFSWSPRGVLMAGRNNAKFLQDGKIVEIDSKDLFKNNWSMKIGGMDLEYYPNRDSLPYLDLYGIQNTRTMFRGTLRYPGWCRTMLVVSQLGMLKEQEITGVKGLSYREIFRRVLGIDQQTDPKDFITRRADIDQKDEIIGKFEWLGLFSQTIFQQEKITPIDFLSMIMQEKMKYSPTERDMIILHHEFEAEFKKQHESITSTLIDYGQVAGDSSMSRTVSLPAAIAVRMILEGRIKERGVRIPVDPEIYEPVLNELAELGIICKEQTRIHKKV
jgi:saccharopine dehydrogenase (NADP+, L-glutamate forming)